MGKDKKAKNKKRSRTRSPSSSDSSVEKLDSKLIGERRQKKKERKFEKLRQKELETPEEKRARRLAKKMQKDQKRSIANNGSIPTELSYTNLNNPFNDSKLTDTFVWGKKLEQDGKDHYSKRAIEKETQKRIQKNLHEAQEFKRVRDARMAAREDRDMMQRDADRREVAQWDSKEQKFQLDQATERSRIRIQQSRAKAIDLLSRFICYGDEKDEKEKDKDNDEFELVDPVSYIKDLSIDDYEDLIEDIKVYRTLEQDKHVSFWLDVRTIVDNELRKRREDSGREREGIHGSLKSEVVKMFTGKSIGELCDLEKQITGKINGAGASNVTYWEGLLEQLKVFISRSRLRELNNKMMRLKLARIREEQMQEVHAIGGGEPSVSGASSSQPKNQELVKQEDIVDEDDDDEEELSKKVRRKVDIAELDEPDLDPNEREHRWRQLSGEQLLEVTSELFAIGSYSPPYNDFDDTMPGIEIIDENDDAMDLTARRNRNQNKGEVVGESDVKDSKMLAIASKGMADDESTFTAEEKLETQKYLWSDKYRPRKPTYLNRVQTGFDWNKYNQTHYDMDNPPPKIVQGYKFNIFYPDLLDHRKTPTFTVTPCDDPDFAVVRFKAGPPYEDIAFKIVNREWEVLHKNGYKCQFQNGVFQLWFVFKRYRYRR